MKPASITENEPVGDGFRTNRQVQCTGFLSDITTVTAHAVRLPGRQLRSYEAVAPYDSFLVSGMEVNDYAGLSR